jgi:hypothetical protein
MRHDRLKGREFVLNLELLEGDGTLLVGGL